MSDSPLFDPPPLDLPKLWITENGPDRDVVVSSRMRLARNIAGYHFKTRFRDDEAEGLETHLRGVLAKADPALSYVAMNKLSETAREVLFERHLVSRELVTDKHPRGVAYSEAGTTCVMVNEEDHLRLQVFAPGLDLDSLDARVNALDDAISEHVPYAFSERFGFLTSCPTNTGTGLRVSVMLHLPALSRRVDGGGGEQGIVKVHNAAQKLGLAVRGMFGESSRAEGDFYQLSNQVTLGRSPEQTVQDLNSVLPKVVEYERKVRKILMETERSTLDDTVWRAWGMLTHARRITSAEALTHLSALRLGLCLDIFRQATLPTVHALMVTMRPGHLQFGERRELTPDERDVVRARLIRDTLNPP